ncbi:hypothetical protein T265_05514 [Opisthorchis viverrini]|uniref:Uncharacterized protein n=1 Tax=Opisthorchis viverrini TaxID=6198 RepID=A0A074ZNP2_OPIVI|nr:hypothetical protein T265_05514 [Opisthorchis viverrini]KER27407.1 hypothetical protein T265_05514 [Opisthorchis viverrini]
MVFGRINSPSIDELITLHRLRWLGHVLSMPVDRLPRKALFAQPRGGWNRARGGQTMTWQRKCYFHSANCMNKSLFSSPIWVQVEHKVDGNWGDCAYLMSPKKGETGRGLSNSFQQPCE